jgi:hypothetical protein
VEDGRWQIGQADWVLGWSDDGSAIYLLDDEYDMVVVPVETGESFETGAPTELFRIESNLTWARFGDGKRFVTAKSPAKAGNDPITLVVDWLPEMNVER